MATIEINGAHIHCEVLGKDNERPLLALHGGPGIADHRAEQKGLSGMVDEFKLVTYDHRGCGQSSNTPPFTNDQYVEDVEAVRRFLRLGKFALYGGSYGGFIALLYALKYPDHLTHLILRDTSPNNQFVVLAKHNALSQSDKTPGLTGEMLDRMFDGTVRDNDDFRELFEAIAPLFWAGPPPPQDKDTQLYFNYNTHNEMFSKDFSRYDITERLDDISVPTLITVGRHDWITPPAASELLAERIPNSKLVVFEHSGHSPQLEESDAYVSALKAFLNA